MANANLLKTLDINNNKLENIVIYGNIKCAIKQPKYIQSDIKLDVGFFALVDVLAIQCNGVDYISESEGYQDSKHIYFSKGDILVFLNDTSLIGKNVKVYGRTTKGCSIRKHTSCTGTEGIVATAWGKSSNDWFITPNKVVPFDNMSVKGTVLEGYVYDDSSFHHPDSCLGDIQYCGVRNYELVEFMGSEDIRYSTERLDLSTVPLNLTYRLETKKESQDLNDVRKCIDILEKNIVSTSKKIKSYLHSEVECEYGSGERLVAQDSIESISKNIVHLFILKVCEKYNIRLSVNTKLKGKDIIDNFLKGVLEDSVSESDSADDREALLKEIDRIKLEVQLDSSVLLPEKVNIQALKDYKRYCEYIIGTVTGVGIKTLSSNRVTCFRRNKISDLEWFWCLIRNPYMCAIIGGGLSVVDCDKIYFGFSKGCNIKHINECRDLLLMLDRIKSVSDRSTLVKKSDLINKLDVYPSSAVKHIKLNKAPYSKDILEVVCLIKGEGINVNISDIGFNGDPLDILNRLNEIGVIEFVDDSLVITTNDLKKEYTIYSTLVKKSNSLTGIQDKDIEQTVQLFESAKGFKLEPLQRDAIQLVKYSAGVLSGCAGSGKTTTSDCMVEAIKTYLPDYELKFGAPTGKAARRLAEVVGGDVKTVHSMFGLGLHSEPYLYSSQYLSKSREGSPCAFILDEMAMANTNLMYEIVKKLREDDLIYFLGDIKQLPPIGKGNPFKSLMKFLPCVELGVSKRASENGTINYNCGLINFVSDSLVVELQEGDDFAIKPCSDAEIPLETVNAFKNMLSVFNEDDIQVVTGYQSDKFSWSTVELNPLLQRLLRKPEDLLYKYNNKDFMLNDRVIHITRNAYDMPRYKMLGNNQFQEVVTFGMVNGEQGKILGCIKASECRLLPWVDKDYTSEEWAELNDNDKLLILRRRKAALRATPSSKTLKNLYFVVVKTYDVDLKEDVVVLYHTYCREDLTIGNHRVFTGGDLEYLDLAYALTTHKMQGSQSKSVIIPIGSKSSSTFINRNMMNTMITRASDHVTMIGSVVGRDSAVTNGRRCTTIDDGADVLSILALGG